MKRFLGYIVVGFLGLYLATLFVPGVKVEGDFETVIKTLFFAGIALGIVNFFIKPIVDLVTFPLRLLTFGLFSLVVNMGMVWIVDILFPKLIIPGLGGLFWTGLIVWFLNFFVPKKRPKIKEE
ncbi:phage holin family protein [Patescibacteria group bacterium]|nr:phage holin family protein [Patescibacteria group bacterium]